MKLKSLFVLSIVPFISKAISSDNSTKDSVSNADIIKRATHYLDQTAINEIHSFSAAYAIIGRRPNMEDRFVVRENVKETGVSLLAVFDGHGDDYVAEFCKTKLFENISEKISEVKKFSQKSKEISGNKIEVENLELEKFLNGSDINYEKIITNEILTADKKLVEELQKDDHVSGSTAIIAVLDGTKLTVANVGDSRGVMCDSNGTAIPLSFDHKPNGESEKARIEKAGGFIVHWGVWRVNGSLALSRAIGDHFLKPNIVIANPDVLEFDLKHHRPKFIILASDGLWDVFGNQESIDFISHHLNEPHFGAKSIVVEAFVRGSMDNISAVVVVFQNGSYRIGTS